MPSYFRTSEKNGPDKTESENKAVSLELAKCGADANMDSIDSLSVFLFVKGTIEERFAFIYEFHIGNTDNAVSKNKLNRVAHRSVSPAEEAGQNLLRPAGVYMVNHGIILDTNEKH
jgi:hypothetical protein